MAFKIRDKKRLILPNTRYAEQMRIDLELDQGYPLTAAQDVEFRKILEKGDVTVQEAVERLIELRPGSAWTKSLEAEAT